MGRRMGQYKGLGSAGTNSRRGLGREAAAGHLSPQSAAARAQHRTGPDPARAVRG